MDKSFIMLENYSRIDYAMYTQKEGDKILSESSHSLEVELTNLTGSQVFKLFDGRIITKIDSNYYEYSSKDDVDLLIEYRPKSQNIIFGLNTFGENFPFHISKMRNQLITNFSFDEIGIDYSEKSLYYIDEIISAEYIAKAIFHSNLKENIINFIAYSGQVYINNHGGEWRMILDSDGVTWQPYLINKKGQLIDQFVWIYDTVCNFQQGEVPSVTAGYYVKLF